MKNFIIGIVLTIIVISGVTFYQTGRLKDTRNSMPQDINPISNTNDDPSIPQDLPPVQTQQPVQVAPPVVQQKPSVQVTTPPVQQAPPVADSRVKISEEQAKNIGLKKTGGGTVLFINLDIDYDDDYCDQPDYEMKIQKGARIYEIEINATTGAITDYDLDD